jgi:hypothetical protein
MHFLGLHRRTPDRQPQHEALPIRATTTTISLITCLLILQLEEEEEEAATLLPQHHADINSRTSP